MIVFDVIYQGPAILGYGQEQLNAFVENSLPLKAPDSKRFQAQFETETCRLYLF